MHSHWAAENLQVIRTLMERSALYRRALAPVMTTAGSLGVLGALPLLFFKVESAPGFCAYWIAVSGMALICSYLLVRR